MRDVNPFDYWEGHASAIEGLGGAERSPDPRYLFHTRYHTVRAGHARFLLKLDRVRATVGELAIRVHAWKPENDSNISLVSGARMLLDGVEEQADVTLPVRFAAQKGVLYALYGYLSEDSDIVAQTLQVAIDETDDGGELLPEPPRSVLASAREADEARPANALLHYGRIDIEHPVSQSCTVEQIAALGLSTTGFFGRERAEDNDAAIAQWSERLCLNALNTYGFSEVGLEGLTVGPVSAEFTRQLDRSASMTHCERGPPPRAGDVFFDLLLMPAGFETAMVGPSDAGDRWEAISDWLGCLKIGGLALIGLRYRADGDLVSSSAVTDAQTLSRNEIGQWSLRLIGGGYSVAPLAFAPVSEVAVDHRGLAGFLLIVQRS